MMTTTYYNPTDPDSINAAIAAGLTVTAESNDMPRRGQPQKSGVVVTVTQAFDGSRGVHVYAQGYRGRFAVRNIQIDGASVVDGPDTY